MKKILVLSFVFFMFPLLSIAQSYTEIIDCGLGQGISYCKPTIIDIDNDGLQDLLIGTINGILWHYQQDSPGSMIFNLITKNFSNILVGQSAAPCFTDLDNNGLLELLVGKSQNNVNLYEQTEPGSMDFILITENLLANDIEPETIPCITDLDHDNLMDLIVGCQDGDLYHYEQDSLNSKTFTLISDSLSGIDVGSFSAPHIYDFDENGLLDLIIGENTRNINHYEQDSVGSTTFNLISENFKNIDWIPRSIPSFCDLNNNGVLDLLIGQQGGLVTLLEKNNQEPISFKLLTDNVLNTIDMGFHCYPEFTDLDNDGLLDMILGTQYDYPKHYEQDAPGSSCFTLLADSLGIHKKSWYTAPCLTDLDGDSLLDMIMGSDIGNLFYYEQQSKGTESFDWVSDNLSNIVVGERSIPCIADIDNDGLQDLIVGNKDGYLYHYEQEDIHSILFTLISDSLSGIDVGRNSAPWITDLDNDGLWDLIVGNSIGSLQHYEQPAIGSADFELVTEFFQDIHTRSYSRPVLVDINNDGLEDLIIGDSDGGIHYFQRNQETGITDDAKSPNLVSLFHNYPNPFNPSTTISYQLSNTAKVSLVIYDILGRKIKTLVDTKQSTGLYRFEWKGKDTIGNHVTSGIYFCTLKSGDQYFTEKIILLK